MEPFRNLNDAAHLLPLGLDNSFVGLELLEELRIVNIRSGIGEQHKQRTGAMGQMVR